MLVKLFVGTVGLAAAAVAYVTLRSDAPAYSHPWSPYAFGRVSGHLEVLKTDAGPREYAFREDCIHTATAAVLDTAAAYEAPKDSWDYQNRKTNDYTSPYGCLYNGYQNRYVQYIVNKLYNGLNVKCIARYNEAEAGRIGYLYSPMLVGQTEDANKSFCVI